MKTFALGVFLKSAWQNSEMPYLTSLSYSYKELTGRFKPIRKGKIF